MKNGLIYLPKKLGLWYTLKANERGLNPGEVMYFAMREYAKERGFKCDHPIGEHILHEKGNKIYRCNLCGFLFYKKTVKGIVNGDIVEKTEIVPRIEEI